MLNKILSGYLLIIKRNYIGGSLMYISDSPIKNLNDDKLNRKKFSSNLAKSVLSYTDEDCLTIALMGKWGSGKTSIINLFQKCLKHYNPQTIIIHFNPWNFSSRNNLLFQFFDTLSNVNNDKFTEYVNKENLKNFGKFLINSVSFSVNSGIFGFGFDPHIDSVLSDDETLIDLKNKIKKDFKKFDGIKVVIIIDDIDRLTNTEIQQIFMLVKSLADFPNVMYLLSFDKEAVEGALDNINVYSPKNFLEKIIQIPITVPKINQFQLDNMVGDVLFEFYNTNYPRDKINISDNDVLDIDEFIKKEFLNVYSLLVPFFKTPRDLYRYINILKFYFSTFNSQININDFMLIIAIQLFDEESYHYIKNNKGLFIVDYDNKKYELKEGNKEKIEKLISSSNDEQSVLRILEVLFPRIKYYLNNSEYGDDWYKEWRYQLRICTEEYFDRYFTLTLGDDELSVLDINDFMILDDTNDISKFILSTNSQNKTKHLFDVMINRMGDISKTNSQYYINSLIDIGDLLNIPYNLFFDKRTYLSRILDDLLKKYETNEERYDALKEAINLSNNSLYVAIELLSDEDFTYNRFDYENNRRDVSQALLNEEDLVKLEDMMCEKIRKWDESGQLWESSELEGILYSWKNWDNGVDVVKKVKEFNLDANNAILFAKGFRNINSTVMHVDSPSELVLKFNIKSMLKYFEDIDDLRNRYIEIFESKSLSDEEKEICQSLLNQLDAEYN